MPADAPALDHPSTSPVATRESDYNINVTQLRLLHHYTMVTAKTLATHLDAEEVNSVNVVHIAFDHVYLLHSLLALAALHISHMERSRAESRSAYLNLAEQHYATALDSFRLLVSDIDEYNFKAILMFAGTLFPYSCALAMAVSSDLDHAFDIVLSNMVLTRKVRPMVDRFFDAMKSSELGRLIPKDVERIDWSIIKVPTYTELVQLRRFNAVIDQVYPPAIVDAYSNAIHLLEMVFQETTLSPHLPSITLLKIWMHFVTNHYVELLSEKQPGALIIFAHYAVLLHRSDYYWFLQGTAEQILKIADVLVPSEWKSWLDWPKEQIWNQQVPSSAG
ncbi:hypothetical protein BU24DRAFT_433717 [Aaosphaeria arxii CBS 175.79]|uniref:C6 transcription factor n=1 Tax=Aaosphaeria arxii CBS 175.79 TaxID=1450172 RepID=A0A6A5XLZ6_9PLEO|nr:uncharacterized protein BU24DRAFT_433717 [Aaosphaeria arxii CBS 175.79]KAF2014278.1 hypothetical protein BU24DRAFT_433717 [Aaosphaeria arxii CBS 175.79]